jgi:hypothetical protein
VSDHPCINDLDRRVINVLDGRDKLKALLREGGLSISDFARKHNYWTENVSRCLSGERPLPEIRDSLAAELGLDRTAVDELIDQRQPQPQRP